MGTWKQGTDTGRSAGDPDEWLTSEWIANDLQVPLSTYYQWRAHRKAPQAIKVGKYVRVRRRHYEEWLSNLAATSLSTAGDR